MCIRDRICPDPRGHLQATGRDARGRKQYRYHPAWASQRDADKYQSLSAFGAQLPRIRRQVGRDMQAPGLPRAKVVAVVVRLLEDTLIRICLLYTSGPSDFPAIAAFAAAVAGRVAGRADSGLP